MSVIVQTVQEAQENAISLRPGMALRSDVDRLSGHIGSCDDVQLDGVTTRWDEYQFRLVRQTGK